MQGVCNSADNTEVRTSFFLVRICQVAEALETSPSALLPFRVSVLCTTGKVPSPADGGLLAWQDLANTSFQPFSSQECPFAHGEQFFGVGWC